MRNELLQFQASKRRGAALGMNAAHLLERRRLMLRPKPFSISKSKAYNHHLYLESKPGAYKTCSLLTCEGRDGQSRPLVAFPGVAKPRGVANPGENKK